MKVMLLFALLLTSAVLVVAQGVQTGRFSVYTAGRCGYINPEGKIVIREQFESCWQFSEGLAAVVLNGKLGFINEAGDFVIKPQFDWRLTYFSEGLAPVSFRDGGGGVKWGYVDKQGKVTLIPAITHASNFVNGLAVVERRPFNGYINKELRFVIEPTFLSAGSFEDELALVRGNDGSWYYIDRLGHRIINRYGGPFSEGVAFFEEKKKYGLMDTAGRVLIAPQYDDAESFSEGLASVKIKDRWGYIDKSGRIVISSQFETSGRFTPDGLAAVMKNGKYGFIDTSGRLIIGFEFDSADWLSSGLGIVERGDNRGYINREGRFVWQSSK